MTATSNDSPGSGDAPVPPDNKQTRYNPLQAHIREALHVVSKSRAHISLALMIFIISAGTGTLMSGRFAGLIQQFSTFVENLMDRGTVGIIIGIFQKNLFAMLMVMLGGIAFGIIPILTLVVNGLLLGVLMMIGLEKGLSIVGFVAAILPHGIFELPAVFITNGVAMRMGFMQFKRKGREPACQRMADGMRVLFFIVVPLLAVAAVIEGLTIARLN